jgi:hypothetical protein
MKILQRTFHCFSSNIFKIQMENTKTNVGIILVGNNSINKTSIESTFTLTHLMHNVQLTIYLFLAKVKKRFYN